jgi:uncharacterized iron-regulated membrane protein
LVLLFENSRTAPFGTDRQLTRSLHAGDIFGAPTQALYSSVSFGIAIQTISGVLIGWNSRVAQ